MPLFKKKKFPEYSKAEKSNRPMYDSQSDLELKKPIMSAYPMPMIKDDLDIDLKSEHTFNKYPGEDLGLPIRKPAKLELRMPEPQYKPYMPQEASNLNVQRPDSNQIFVKLEDYKKAVKTIFLVKDKIKEAEEILTDILELKRQEDQQISEWMKETTEIKNKLMELDRNLFEA